MTTGDAALRGDDPPQDPLELFRAWDREGDHRFMALATASSSGRPSVRMVGLQTYDRRGFVFFTGVESRKGREQDADPVPADWGAYRLVPDVYEFWQYREDKLHDRFRYRREPDGSWSIDRLLP